MKYKIPAIICAFAILLSSTARAPAVEGLQISVKCPDVSLGLAQRPGENYIVQWRPNLDPGTPWVTLTNSLPAEGPRTGPSLWTVTGSVRLGRHQQSS